MLNLLNEARTSGRHLGTKLHEEADTLHTLILPPSDEHIASIRSIKAVVGTAVGTENKTATQICI
jgi:hypothetical protein